MVCVRRHFAAEVSDHPEALAPVEPFLKLDMADPRIVDAVDIISELDRRPNLMDPKGILLGTSLRRRSCFVV